jgi:hypothetical protein
MERKLFGHGYGSTNWATRPLQWKTSPKMPFSVGIFSIMNIPRVSRVLFLVSN